MRPHWSKALRFRKAFRHLTIAALGLLQDADRVLPLGERGQRPAAGVHQHYRAWPLFGRNRGVRPDLRLR